MNEIKRMVDTLCKLAFRRYDKDMLFYDWNTSTWYSRYHCEELTTHEVCDWILELYPWEDDYE